jgi:hypothetical protein
MIAIKFHHRIHSLPEILGDISPQRMKEDLTGLQKVVECEIIIIVKRF